MKKTLVDSVVEKLLRVNKKGTILIMQFPHVILGYKFKNIYPWIKKVGG